MKKLASYDQDFYENIYYCDLMGSVSKSSNEITSW